MNSYHYGQAPNQPYGAPFTYSAGSRNPTASYRTLPLQGACFNPSAPNVYGTAGQPGTSAPVYGTQNLTNQPPISQIQPTPAGIRPASEIYPTGNWPADPSRAPGYGARESITPMFRGQYSAKGGKGWIGKGSSRSKGGPGAPVGNAANAIPLGRDRVFAKTAASGLDEERRHDRQRSPNRPPAPKAGAPPFPRPPAGCQKPCPRSARSASRCRR